MLPVASAAEAGSYTRNWPVTIAKSQRLNETACITLTDDGTFGRPHSGAATFAGEPWFGTFQVIGSTIAVTFQQPGGTAQDGGLLFVARAGGGTIGRGIIEQVGSGTNVWSGVAAFGPAGGC